MLRSRLLLPVVLVTAAALVGSASAHAGGATASPTKTVQFTVGLSSEGTTLRSLPGEVVYGWNHLVGSTEWGRRTASVEFLGSVDYVDGTGPFNGFVTFTRSDGTQLAVSATGWATTPPDQTGTADARFGGTLRVIGGSGPYAGAQGTGTMSGYRKAALGSPVVLTFSLTIQK